MTECRTVRLHSLWLPQNLKTVGSLESRAEQGPSDLSDGVQNCPMSQPRGWCLVGEQPAVMEYLGLDTLHRSLWCGCLSFLWVISFASLVS